MGIGLRTCEKCCRELTAIEYQSDEGLCLTCQMWGAIEQAMPRGGTVLDVGSGLGWYGSKLHAHCGGNLVLLDAHLPYMTARDLPPRIPLMIGELQTVLPLIREGQFDACLMCDVLEHLTPNDAAEAVVEMKRIAPIVAMLVPNDVHIQTSDPYKLGGDFWQTHKSTWYEPNLQALGFSTQLWRNFHRGAGEGKAPHAIWATWMRGDAK